MKDLGEKEVNRMKDLGEKGIRIANIIFVVEIIFFSKGKIILSYIFLALWLLSFILLIKSTKSTAMRIIYLLAIVIFLLWLFFPMIYYLFLNPTL